MTVEEIADLEGTTHQAISKSVRKAVEEIKKIMKIYLSAFLFARCAY